MQQQPDGVCRRGTLTVPGPDERDGISAGVTSKTSFIQRRLEEITASEVEVTALTSFVNELCTLSSQATKLRSSGFIAIWDGYMKNVTLVFQLGSWIPKSFGTQEISQLDDFETFLASVHCSRQDSQDSHSQSSSSFPFTINELLQHYFWKDFYQSFGRKAIDFVLKHCLILFEKEDNFYIMVSSDSCLLSQKIGKYRFKLRLNSSQTTTTTLNNKPVGFRNPYRIPSLATQVLNPFQRLRANINKKNKMYLKTLKRKRTANSSSESSVSSSSSLMKRPKLSQDSDSGSQDICKGRKRMNTDHGWEFERDKNAKRLKSALPFSDNQANSTSSKQRNDMLMLRCKQCRPSCTAPEGLIRWFMPSPSVLETIVKLRQQLKVNLGCSTSSADAESSTSQEQVQLNFIGIFVSDTFVSKFNYGKDMILKSSTTIQPPYCKIPTCWSGIEIELRNDKAANWIGVNKPISVTVYKITDHLARKENIRINKRDNKRQRMRKQDLINNETVNHTSSSSTFATPTESPNECLSSKPYDALLPLNTWTVFYSKTSSFKWPCKHIISIVQASSSVKNACSAVLQSIFQTEIGVVVVKDTPPMFPGLLEAVKKFVTFHRHVKDINRYIRDKVEFWGRKRYCKLQRKQKKTSEVKKNSYNISKLAIRPFLPSVEVETLNTDTNETSKDSIENSTTLMSVEDPGQMNSNPVSVPNRSSKVCQKTTTEEEIEGNTNVPGITHPVNPSCVLMTLKQICRRSGVADLLGSGRNFRAFFKFVRKAIVLAGTKSSLHFGQLMSLLDSHSVSWLAEITAYNVSLFAQVVLWIFNEFVLVLLKVGFYITEGSDTRKHTVFLLKQKWKSMVERVKAKYMKTGTLIPCGKVEANSTRKEVSDIEASLRFVPKQNLTLRPILSRTSKTRRSVTPYQQKLWKSILSFFVNQASPHRIKDMNFVRKRWSLFLQEWRDSGRQFLYFIKTDIQDAYPSVNLMELSEFLDQIAKSEKRMVKKEFRIISNSRVVYKQVICPNNCVDGWDSAIISRPCIVQQTSKIDQPLETEQEFSKIKSNFKKTRINFGKLQYDFDNGLPQGWALSEVLCNLYYGRMDSVYLESFLNHPGEFLVTSVDDYLFISPSPSRVSEFAEKFSCGLKAFRSELNLKKLNSNLWPSNRKPVSDIPCETIGLSGNRYCLSCGHVRRDVSGYAGQDISSTISFNMTSFSSPEKFLIVRMKSMLALRLSAIFLDPKINCRQRIAANIFEMALLLAFRFYAICRVIYPSLRVFQDHKVSDSAVKAIRGSAHCFCSMVTGVLRTTYSPRPQIHCWTEDHINKCPCIELPKCEPARTTKLTNSSLSQDFQTSSVTRAEVFFLIYTAFVTKLNRHSESFRTRILPSVCHLRNRTYYDLNPDQRVFVQSVVGNFEFNLPSEFSKIKI